MTGREMSEGSAGTNEAIDSIPFLQPAIGDFRRRPDVLLLLLLLLLKLSSYPSHVFLGLEEAAVAFHFPPGRSRKGRSGAAFAARPPVQTSFSKTFVSQALLSFLDYREKAPKINPVAVAMKMTRLT